MLHDIFYSCYNIYLLFFLMKINCFKQICIKIMLYIYIYIYTEVNTVMVSHTLY